MVNTYESGFKTTLSIICNPADTTLNLATVPTTTAGRLYLSDGSQEEWISYTGISGSTVTGCTRGLSQTADPATAGTGLTWLAGTKVKLVAMHDQLPDKQQPTTFTQNIVATDITFTGTTTGGLKVKSLTTAQRTGLAAPADGMIVYDSTIGENYQYISGAWSAVSAGSTQPNASTTVAGKIQLPTDGQITAGTPTGGTGATLTPTNEQQAKSISLKGVAGTLVDANEFVINQGGVDKRIAASLVGDYVRTTPVVGSESILDVDTYIAGEAITSGNSLFVEDETTFALATSVQNVGDVTVNTRIAIRHIGSGVSASTMKLSLKKFVSPSVDLGVRIETDNAGSPSGTLIDANATATVTAASLSTSLADTTVTFAGAFTITKGTVVHIVIFQGTYGAETINATNYYGVGYELKQTTIRTSLIYDGSSWTTGLGPTVTDDDGNVLVGGAGVSTWNGYRIQARDNLVITVVNKDALCTATRCRIRSDDNTTTLGTTTFVGNIATFSTPISVAIGDYVRVEVDNSGANYNDRLDATPIFPVVATNIIYNTGSVSGVNSTSARNIATIESKLTDIYFFYTSSSLLEAKLLGLTNSLYSYKNPVDVPRLATETVAAGAECISTTFGLNTQVTGLTSESYYYTSETPGGLSTTPGASPYLVGQAITSEELYVTIQKDNNVADEITSVEQSQLNGTTTGTAIRFLNGGIVTVQLQITNASGNSRDLTSSLQYSEDNVTRITVKSLSQSNSSNYSTARGAGQIVFTYVVKPGMYIRLYTYSSGYSATSYANIYYQA